MNITDYTEPKSTMTGPVLPSRFCSYMVDLMKLFFSDERNISVPELKGLRHIDGDSIAAINGSDLYIDTAWPESDKVSGKVPAVIVMYGNMESSTVGTASQLMHGAFPGAQRLLTLSYSMSLSVRTTSYPGTQILSEMLYTYLHTFAKKIQEDSGVSSFSVAGMTSPELSQSQGDSKDVFRSSIVCKVTSTYISTVDTTGPVFRGLTLNYV